MEKTDALIAELTRNPAACRAMSPAALALAWLWVVAVYGAALVFIQFPLRPDLMVKIKEGAFVAEILSLAMLILSSALAAGVLAYPDLRQNRTIVYLPVFAFVGFMAVLGFEVWVTPWASPPHEGIECCLTIAALALLPGCFLFMLLRRLATVRPQQAGCVAALAAFGVGALILRLSEQTDSITHLLTWHYAPMMVVAVTGLWLGQRFLKW